VTALHDHTLHASHTPSSPSRLYPAFLSTTAACAPLWHAHSFGFRCKQKYLRGLVRPVGRFSAKISSIPVQYRSKFGQNLIKIYNITQYRAKPAKTSQYRRGLVGPILISFRPVLRTMGVLPHDRTTAAASLCEAAPTQLLLSPPPRAPLARARTRPIPGCSAAAHRCTCSPGAAQLPAHCHPPSPP
jgi:hypothetical protein